MLGGDARTNDLLASVLRAQGGLDRWNTFEEVSGTL